jgi:23S rRNA (adenine2030-N6)-methyltransferase
MVIVGPSGYHQSMFSYRHAFHAGNHADVLKHITLLATLRHLMQKEAGITLIDTHAGAGLYRLDGDYSQKGAEAEDGLFKLLAAVEKLNSLPEPVHDYLEQIASFNPNGQAKIYPGSPFLMQKLMRHESRDRLRLFELHPTDSKSLTSNIAQLGAGRTVTVSREDGFEALKKLLPPPPSATGSKRAMVLIDPSYEIKSDYAKVANVIQEYLKRFSTGTYLVWYPIIPRPEAHDLPRRLRTLANQAQKPWLNATLAIGRGPGDEGGLVASGMFVINPPFTLKDQIRQALDVVGPALARGSGKSWQVESS